jgi:beta-galactosidase
MRKVSPLAVRRESGALIVENKEFSVRFNETTGAIERVRAGDKTIALAGPKLNTWRPLQLVEMTQPSFKQYGLLPLLQGMTPAAGRFDVVGQTEETALISVSVLYNLPGKPGMGFRIAYKYEIRCDGEIAVDYKIEPELGDAQLLELGVMFKLPSDFDRLTVFGRGPDTYPRSIGNTETSMIQKMAFTPHDPGFSANKTDVRWTEISNGAVTVRFDLPDPDGLSYTENARAEHGDDATFLFFNPWEKHPSKKNADPPPEYMVRVRDGDSFNNRLVVKLLQ